MRVMMNNNPLIMESQENPQNTHTLILIIKKPNIYKTNTRSTLIYDVLSTPYRSVQRIGCLQPIH